MQITKIIITEEERNKAISEWFKNRFGLDLKVTNISKNYSSGGGFEVEIEDPEERLDEPKPAAMAQAEQAPAAATGEF